MQDLISRQAAIEALRVAYFDNNIQSAKDDPCIVDAMTDWAIRQVKALSSAQPDVPDICVGDMISRQAAISHVDDVPYIKDHPNVGLLWKAWIESLPSAQPEHPDINVGNMDDCISRQATIEALQGRK